VKERLLTARELGEYLGLAPATILDKWERREIPGFKSADAATETVRVDKFELTCLGP
jgi:hypothetical protein